MTTDNIAATETSTGWRGTIALTGFMLVAIAQVSNMILARGLAGSVPAFSLAFFRWTIIAAGLAPFAIAEIRQGKFSLWKNIGMILVTGFLGMFLCGGPVYIAEQSTTAIHIALIMALSPVTVPGRERHPVIPDPARAADMDPGARWRADPGRRLGEPAEVRRV